MQDIQRIAVAAAASFMLAFVATQWAFADAPQVAPSADEAVPAANLRVVSKCLVDGITTYSDRGCAAGSFVGQLSLRPEPDNAGSQALRNTPAAVRQAHCEAARSELRNIDALTSQGQPPEMQAFLDGRRQEKTDELFLYRC